MKSDVRYIVKRFIWIGLLSLISLDPISAEIETIKGVYGNPKQLWEKEPRLSKLGVNAIFVRSKLIDQELINRARTDGLMVFAEFATLNGKNYVEEHPEAWAINEKGEKVQAASWFMGVCPTEPYFRRYRFDQLRELVSTYQLDGIWLDYVHWHAQFEEPEPILPETCFCDTCLDAFSGYSGITLPEGTITIKAQWILNNHDDLWREWRCKVVFDWVDEMNNIIKQYQPEALLGLYHCPWDDDEFDGALRRILGLDLDLLKETVDVFSPMVYHARMGKKTDWVHEYVNWLGNRLDIGKEPYPRIWPIVQAHDGPEIISSEEFETVLRHGLSGRSTGVMMFTSSTIAENHDKRAVMKRVYTTFDRRNEISILKQIIQFLSQKPKYGSVEAVVRLK